MALSYCSSRAPEQSIRANSATDEQRQVNLIDNLSVTKGSHQLKFGVDYRWLALSAVRSPTGNLRSSRECRLRREGPFRERLSRRYRSPMQSNALLSQNFSLYGQDTWKITPRFTLTYGLRWDINPPLKGKNAANDPFTVTGLDNPATMTLAPRGTPLYETTYGNVAPRLGLA